MIRVLCVFSTLDRGGAESMCMNLYRNIDRTKVQFDFVKHTPKKGAFEDEITQLGGRIYEAPRYKGVNHYAYCNWWKQHLEKHPEHLIIHGHFFSISAIYFREAKKKGRITIGHSHIAKIDSFAKKVYIKPIERYADYRFACGVEAGKTLYPHKSFKVINNAIDAKRFRFNEEVRAEYRKKLGLEEAFVVGIVANLIDHKNPIGVIRIFKAIHDLNPNAYLLWLGEGGMREEIESLVDNYNLNKYVIMPGVSNEIEKILQAMDVFILPSYYEGLPVVMIEAQAAGLPCFVSDKVTQEADITGLCKYLPLERTDVWSKAVLSAQNKRQDTSELIIKSGYDIEQTSQWMQNFYILIAKGRQ